MNKSKRVTERELLIELVKSNAAIDAHLFTLFTMQCELIAYLSNAPLDPIIIKWSKFRAQLLKDNLANLTEEFKGRE